MPYTDALQGTSVILPKYDKAQAVYDSLFMQLDHALAYRLALYRLKYQRRVVPTPCRLPSRRYPAT
ncbi:MAG: hypothetical protein H7319_21865 [Spirosoma sp.]|nr:hypothetical protein [Spirosoma sp.]